MDCNDWCDVNITIIDIIDICDGYIFLMACLLIQAMNRRNKVQVLSIVVAVRIVYNVHIVDRKGYMVSGQKAVIRRDFGMNRLEEIKKTCISSVHVLVDSVLYGFRVWGSRIYFLRNV